MYEPQNARKSSFSRIWHSCERMHMSGVVTKNIDVPFFYLQRYILSNQSLADLMTTCAHTYPQILWVSAPAIARRPASSITDRCMFCHAASTSSRTTTTARANTHGDQMSSHARLQRYEQLTLSSHNNATTCTFFVCKNTLYQINHLRI